MTVRLLKLPFVGSHIEIEAAHIPRIDIQAVRCNRLAKADKTMSDVY